MLILLPPSEAKTAPAVGNPAEPSELWLPALAPARRRVLTRLAALCGRTRARSVADSLQRLGLSAAQVPELPRNAALLTAPAGPAAEVYTGVLYEALQPATLTPSERAWLDQSVAIFSGLWGVIRLTDHIPAYRCSVSATLPAPVGGLTAYWKKVLRVPLGQAAGAGPVLDLRSGAYAAMWSPTGPAAASVRVLHERVVDGVAQRSIVSHFNKAAKGRMVRALAGAGGEIRTIDEAVTALRDLKFAVEEQAVEAGRCRQLDLIVAEL